MRVLLVGTSPFVTERATRELIRAGHEVVRCHAQDEAPFPCRALLEGRGCPLDAGPVDVVVDCHARPSRVPALGEGGVVCGLRAGIPLVVAGSPVHPYWRWAAIEIGHDGDLLAACEQAADASFEQHAEVRTALEAARAALAAAGVDPAGTAALVHRRGDQLHVLLELPPRPAGVHATVVAAVVGELRALHPDVAIVDVAIA
jgi:hypothetical protein